MDYGSLAFFDFKTSLVLIEKEEDIAMSTYNYRVNLKDLDNGGKLFLNKSMYEKLFSNKVNRYPISVRKGHKLISEFENTVEINYNYMDNLFCVSELSQNIQKCNYILETSISNMIHGSINYSENILTEQLEILLEGKSVIPYDIGERRKVFTKAFEELGLQQDELDYSKY